MQDLGLPPPIFAWIAGASEDASRKLANLSTVILLLTTLTGLGFALMIGNLLRRQPETKVDPLIVRAFNRRLTAWFTFTAILAAALVINPTMVVALFGLVSFWALREFITMTPTRRADHRALFWSFFVFTPAQFVLVGLGEDYILYFSTMIPVYASLLLPARIAFTGDHKRFLERAAKIQFGLLVCVYSLSFTPALLDMDLQVYNPDSTGEADRLQSWQGSNAGLLFFFVLIVQLGDLLQFIWDKAIGRHVICPKINASKTWEGLFGGVISVGVLGAIIQAVLQVTPFYTPGAGFMAALIAFMGCCGSLTMSAIKRDRGVKDYGTLVHGHAGVLDRIDSLCFAAPVFYFVTRLFLGSSGI